MKIHKVSSFLLAVSLLFASGCSKVEEAIPVEATIRTDIVSEETTAETTVETTETTTAETVHEPQLTSHIHIAAAGDNLIHSSLYEQAARRANGDGYDFAYEYDNVDDHIESADIAILNQETLICNDMFKPSTYPCFNSPKALGDHMINIGFDVFTMANNHVLDKGESGLSACLDYWDSRPEAVVLGAYRNAEDKENIRTLTEQGVTFSFLSYTESTNGLKLPAGSELVIGNANDVDGMVSDIKKAKEISDLCIVSLHWGVEDSSIISDIQRSTAKKLADAGADVIIGTHPHVLRDIEWIEREDGGKMLCAYSLGNFVSAQSKPRNLIGGVLDFYVDRYDDGEPYITDVSLLPTIQHYDARYSDNRVYFYSQYSDELAKSHGINSSYRFDMDYIDSVINETVSPEFLGENKASDIKLNSADYVLDESFVPIYDNVKFADSHSGSAGSYEELRQYVNAYEDISFVGYEIISQYSPEEAVKKTGDDIFKYSTTLYKAHIYYDYLNDTPIDMTIDLAKAGLPNEQVKDDPPYAVGQRIVSAVSGYSGTSCVAIPELVYYVFDVNGTDMAYHVVNGGIIVRNASFPNLDMDIIGEEASLIITTKNNPVKFTQKSLLSELTEFIKQDWTAQGFDFFDLKNFDYDQRQINDKSEDEIPVD